MNDDTSIDHKIVSANFSSSHSRMWNPHGGQSNQVINPTEPKQDRRCTAIQMNKYWIKRNRMQNIPSAPVWPKIWPLRARQMISDASIETEKQGTECFAFGFSPWGKVDCLRQSIPFSDSDQILTAAEITSIDKDVEETVDRMMNQICVDLLQKHTSSETDIISDGVRILSNQNGMTREIDIPGPGHDSIPIEMMDVPKEPREDSVECGEFGSDTDQSGGSLGYQSDDESSDYYSMCHSDDDYPLSSERHLGSDRMLKDHPICRRTTRDNSFIDNLRRKTREAFPQYLKYFCNEPLSNLPSNGEVSIEMPAEPISEIDRDPLTESGELDNEEDQTSDPTQSDIFRSIAETNLWFDGEFVVIDGQL